MEQTWDYVTLVIIPDEHSISWEPQLEDLHRREGDCGGGAQNGRVFSQGGFSAERSFGSASV